MGKWKMAQWVNHNLVLIIIPGRPIFNFVLSIYRYVPSLNHEKVKYQFGHFHDLSIFEEYKEVFNYMISAEFCIIADWGGIIGINVKIRCPVTLIPELSGNSNIDTGVQE